MLLQSVHVFCKSLLELTTVIAVTSSNILVNISFLPHYFQLGLYKPKQQVVTYVLHVVIYKSYYIQNCIETNV